MVVTLVVLKVLLKVVRMVIESVLKMVEKTVGRMERKMVVRMVELREYEKVDLMEQRMVVSWAGWRVNCLVVERVDLTVFWTAGRRGV